MGYTITYFPFGALSLLPEMAVYHKKLNLDEVIFDGIHY